MCLFLRDRRSANRAMCSKANPQFPPNNSSTVGFTGSNVQGALVPSDLFVHIFFALSAAFKEQPEAAPAPARRPGKLAYAGRLRYRVTARRRTPGSSGGRTVRPAASWAGSVLQAALVANQSSRRRRLRSRDLRARRRGGCGTRDAASEVVIGAESALVLRVGSHGFSLPFVRCVRNRNSRAILRPQLSS